MIKDNFYEFLKGKIELAELEKNDVVEENDIVLENKLLRFNTNMDDLEQKMKNLTTKIQITKSTFDNLRNELDTQFHLDHNCQPLEFRYFPEFGKIKEKKEKIIKEFSSLNEKIKYEKILKLV